MNIETLVKLYMEGEKECWQYTDYIKHNPVLYPRVGDVFLKELFTLSNPNTKIAFHRRKKVQIDNLWYRVNKKTLLSYIIGCEIVGKNSNCLDIHLDNGNRIPFFVYWFLTCVFLGEAEGMSLKRISKEAVSRLRKEKDQKGICRPDCRKYYKNVGLITEHIASDFPLSKNFCPLKQEFICELKCPTALKIGDLEIKKGLFNYRRKEELLFLHVVQDGFLSKEMIAGELLFQFIKKEYAAFYDLIEKEKTECKGQCQDAFNCQLYTVFSYVMDSLTSSAWLKWLSEQEDDSIKDILTNQNLWQLLDVTKEKVCLPEQRYAWLITLSEILHSICLETAFSCEQIEMDFTEQGVVIRLPHCLDEDEKLLSYKNRMMRLNQMIGKPFFVFT